jgi:hypothetical protein
VRPSYANNALLSVINIEIARVATYNSVLRNLNKDACRSKEKNKAVYNL